MSLIIKSFSAAMKPPSQLAVDEWCVKYVKLPHSARSPEFDINATPYLREPMLSVADNSFREVIIIAPVGAGKTTMQEGLYQWIIAEEPGPTLVTAQTDDAAKDWVDTRFAPSLKLNPKLLPLIPTGKNKNNFRKNEIIFPHMPIHFGGANLSNLQSKSILWVFGDEGGLWKDGMLEEARRRTHDRWNSRVVLVSQGGVEGDQLDSAFQDGEIHDFSFLCPSCQTRQKYEWKQMKFERIKNIAEEWDWEKISATVHYACINDECEATFEDKPESRRRLSMSGEYVSRHNNHKLRRISYTWPAMAVWWIEWSKLVEEWITAEDERKKLNFAPLRQFIQKRLAQTWVELRESAQLKSATDAYNKKEYHNGEKWELEHFRFMSVDVQIDYFVVVIRAWSVDGASRLLWEGRIETWEGLRVLQERMKIPNKCVGVDRGFRPDECAKQAALSVKPSDRDRWTLFLGEESDGYTIKRGKHRVKVPFSQWQNSKSNAGITYKYIKFSNRLNKDVLSSLMRGDGASWEVPHDHSPAYKKEMENEIKREVSPGKWRYVKVKNHIGNHCFDCEVMQIVFASAFKIFNHTEKVE